MTEKARQYPFVNRERGIGTAGLMPMLPLTLTAVRRAEVTALLDTGAAINVLPFTCGTELGFEWSRQTTPVQLGGSLAATDARVVAVSATIAEFPPVRLAFAWVRSDQVPVILGHMNFFLEFDVCFFRSRQHFEIRPARTSITTP